MAVSCVYCRMFSSIYLTLWLFSFLKNSLLIFWKNWLERGRERKRGGVTSMWVRNIDWLSPARLQLGIKPATEACAPIRNRTNNLSVHGQCPINWVTLARADFVFFKTKIKVQGHIQNKIKCKKGKPTQFSSGFQVLQTVTVSNIVMKRIIITSSSGWHMKLSAIKFYLPSGFFL